MKIVVIGLGYVGLPLAVELAKHFQCWGLDVSRERIAELKRVHDRTGEVTAVTLSNSALVLTTDATTCPPADVYIVTVPTPIDAENRPDLSPLISATRTVATMIDTERNPIIVYESTVYPGVTEDICGPLIESLTGSVRGKGFRLGYSPERINPGDREHTIDRIVKVIAGDDAATTDVLASVYGKVTSAGVFRATSIKVAEAAKVIENAQRDINIAFMNEITRIFALMGLSIWDVLEAAGTKWNFLPFTPGLVGGHCIGVDPYYLSHRAQELGHNPQVILAGRATNDSMGTWIGDQIAATCPGGARALVLGLTFKEDVPDLRNSKVIDVIRRLRERGFDVDIADPLADCAEAQNTYGLNVLSSFADKRYDVVVGAVAHSAYRAMTADTIDVCLVENGIAFDLKGMWRGTTARALGSRYRTL
jgi:UDP-N-acetyl-D-glucosamine/UDP-N-acetyl-D-galactosamine dehydrogenase